MMVEDDDDHDQRPLSPGELLDWQLSGDFRKSQPEPVAQRDDAVVSGRVWQAFRLMLLGMISGWPIDLNCAGMPSGEIG